MHVCLELQSITWNNVHMEVGIKKQEKAEEKKDIPSTILANDKEGQSKYSFLMK